RHDLLERRPNLRVSRWITHGNLVSARRVADVKHLEDRPAFGSEVAVIAKNTAAIVVLGHRPEPAAIRELLPEDGLLVSQRLPAQVGVAVAEHRRVVEIDRRELDA